MPVGQTRFHSFQYGGGEDEYVVNTLMSSSALVAESVVPIQPMRDEQPAFFVVFLLRKLGAWGSNALTNRRARCFYATQIMHPGNFEGVGQVVMQILIVPLTTVYFKVRWGRFPICRAGLQIRPPFVILSVSCQCFSRRVAKSFVVPPLGGNCGLRPAKAGTTNDFAVVLNLSHYPYKCDFLFVMMGKLL
jgi:hypothetical protein